jgi:hypothetical protein
VARHSIDEGHLARGSGTFALVRDLEVLLTAVDLANVLTEGVILYGLISIRAQRSKRHHERSQQGKCCSFQGMNSRGFAWTSESPLAPSQYPTVNFGSAFVRSGSKFRLPEKAKPIAHQSPAAKDV